MALFAVQTTAVMIAPERMVELASGKAGMTAGPTLIVSFVGDAKESAIRDLLLELDLMIINGPSALGLYTLAASDQITQKEAFTHLQKLSKLIDSAELGM